MYIFELGHAALWIRIRLDPHIFASLGSGRNRIFHDGRIRIRDKNAELRNR